MRGAMTRCCLVWTWQVGAFGGVVCFRFVSELRVGRLLWCRFTERGQLFSREEVRALQVGPNFLVFSGDSSGELKVWSWVDPPPEALAE